MTASTPDEQAASTPADPTILLTGGTGLAGSAVVREFIRSGRPVRVLVRDLDRAAALRAYPTIELVQGDLLKPETLRGPLTGVDRALLLSAPDARLVEAQTGFVDV